MPILPLFLLLGGLCLLAACAETPPTQFTPSTPVILPSVEPTSTPAQSDTLSASPTSPPLSQQTNLPNPAASATSQPTVVGVDAPPPPTPRPTLAYDEWMELPIIPVISDRARQIYQQGLSLGRDPRAFSKVGDCQVNTDRFLEAFDIASGYNLGEYASLQDTIDWFQGSFSRDSLAARDAMRAESLFSPLFADPKLCQPAEGPLACEYRLQNPSIAIISMEQTWSPSIDLEKYEQYMRQAIEYTISLGIVPILATKADNLEGDHQINNIIAHLAWEYEIPLWNFWLAVQPLKNHGLVAKTPTGEPDLFHLTVGYNYDFSQPTRRWTGYTARNLTALQSLDALWRSVTQP
ncbi:MAG: hypothetical protein JW726_07390 [Anaerolineales bacterium]|nr:hypothetical protein [Anaerolineales bacterium]